MSDLGIFNKIVRRFLQNIAALMKRLEKFKQEINLAANPTPSVKTDQKLIEYEQQTVKSYKKQFGSKAPQSFVGDYLHCVAQ